MTANVQSMVSGRGIIPWHKLGNVVLGCMTGKEALEKASMLWEVEKRNLQDAMGNLVGNRYFGIFRKDNNVCLGVVGDTYTISQNEEGVEIFDNVLGISGAYYETAGVLGKGEKIWIMAYLGAAWNLPGTDDKWERRLLYTTSHDGTMQRIIKLVSTRVVCQNTLTYALSEDGLTVKVKHTKNADEKMKEAFKVINKATQTEDELKEKLTILASRLLTRESAVSIFNRIFPVQKGKEEASTRAENNKSKILELFESNDRDEFKEVKGSGYNLLNAFTAFYDHASTVKKQKRNDYSEDELRAISSIWGGNAEKKNNVLDIIYDNVVNNPVNDAYTRLANRYSISATMEALGGNSTPSILDSIIGS